MKLVFISILLFPMFCFGQKQGNIWYFGKFAGIDFNSRSPVALTNGQLTFPVGEFHNEGTSAISDSSGSIMFYSDGMTVWNKNHQIMQNGTGLLGNYSSTQSSIIVPDPANPNRYFYLFTVSSGFCCNGSIDDGLRYSKIDMCLDSSRGGIIQTEKNIKLVDTVAEKLAVTRHSNGIDYWILTHKYYSNEFWALHLTSIGIIDTIITSIGSTHTGSLSGSQGQLKFSPNGQKIAIGASNGLNILELFDFDKSTGIISNCQTLNRINNGSVYGVEFSSDGSKLYTISSSSSPFGMNIGQYDLSSGNLASINASLISIYNETISTTGRGLQIGPDNKIYLVSILNSGALSVINNPNVQGTGCNYQDQSISLNGKQGSYSLPGFISNFDYSNGLNECEQSGILENYINGYITIYPNPIKSVATLHTGKPFQNATFTIYNSFGQTVKQIKNISGQTIVINRDNLENGIYFIQMTQDNKVISIEKIAIIE